MARSSIPAGLLTEQQVLAALRKEVDFTSLSAVAKKYGLQASQISDVLKGRAQLSKRMTRYLGIKIHKFYERLGKNDSVDFSLDR